MRRPPERRRGDRRLTAPRAGAAALAATGLFVGIWALLAPHGFYTGFPGLGHHWVDRAGAYDEHLVRDVGAFYLALGALAAGAARWPSIGLIRGTFAAWIIFSLPHLAFHVGHLHGYPTGDAVAQTASLTLTALGPAALLVLTRR